MTHPPPASDGFRWLNPATNRQPETSLPDCGNVCASVKGSRRDFLFATGSSLVLLALPGLGSAQAQRADHPRKLVVANLNELHPGVPVPFRYPWDHPNCDSILIKLGTPAAGGIGPEQDIVAFNALCPHMGWTIPGELFFHDPGMAGPCPGHLTTFDLTRHGMVVSGHATQGLPQVVLEQQGDEVFAVGVQGLLFGFFDNRIEPKT